MLMKIIIIFLCFYISSTKSQLPLVTVPSTAVCESGWYPLPTIPCHCYWLMFPTHPVNWLSAEQECLNFDSRTKLAEFATDSELASFQQAVQPAANAFNARDIPIGLYKSINGATRHPSDQSLLPTTGLSYTANMPPGKCAYVFTEGQFLTNSSCMMTVPALGCQMDCGLNVPHPPPPTVTAGAPRCNDSNFNMACPTNWINLGGICYINPVDSNTLLTYSQAVNMCQTIGGWLPSFSNINEWQAVVNYAYQRVTSLMFVPVAMFDFFSSTVGISGADSWAAPMWLGGTQSGTTAQWTDGTSWSFSYWAPYQPNTNSSCIWWSVGQGNYWSTAKDCNIPGVVFCQWYSCSKHF